MFQLRRVSTELFLIFAHFLLVFLSSLFAVVVTQMRYFWTSEKQCIMRICDAEFIYAFEFIGNPGRLVITPLTDRCYITLTQV